MNLLTTIHHHLINNNVNAVIVTTPTPYIRIYKTTYSLIQLKIDNTTLQIIIRRPTTQPHQITLNLDNPTSLDTLNAHINHWQRKQYT